MPCLSQNPSLGPPTEDREIKEKIDAIVKEKMKTYVIPGLAIGLVEKEAIVYTKGYGLRNIKSADSVSEYTNFHTASISKLLTAQAIMMLIDQKAIGLEDQLTKVLPNLKYKDERVKQITIKMLLNHTSGLEDIKNYQWGKDNSSETVLQDYILGLNLKLKSAPASQYDYSNLGYDILGYVIEKASGIPFEKYLKENILDASGMLNSDFDYFKIRDQIRSAPHSKKSLSKKVYVRKTYPYNKEHAPSSTLNSSAFELSQWMLTFLKSYAQGEHNVASMLEPSFPAYPYIGLGFQLSSLDGHNTVGHYGGDKGYRSYLLMLPEKKIGLVLLANCDYNEDFRQEILHPIAQLLLKRH